MLPDPRKLNELMSLGPQLTASLQESRDWLECLFIQAQKTNQMLERVHGSTDGLNLEKYPPRGLSRLPLILEGSTNAKAVVKFVEDGYTPSDGFYANLGDTAMLVTLIGVQGNGVEHTVPAGASIAVRSLVTGALVRPKVDGETVSYQFYLF